MSLDLETVPETAVQGDLLETAASPLTLSLQDFVSEFGDELLDSLNRANPPVYTGQVRGHRQLILATLKRKLFPAQADVVHAVTELLVDRGERAVGQRREAKDYDCLCIVLFVALHEIRNNTTKALNKNNRGSPRSLPFKSHQ